MLVSIFVSVKWQQQQQKTLKPQHPEVVEDLFLITGLSLDTTIKYTVTRI